VKVKEDIEVLPEQKESTELKENTENVVLKEKREIPEKEG